MPLFVSETEFQDIGDNIVLVAEKADAYIRGLLQQLEEHRARADAAAIMAEQRGAVVEQKFLAMSSQFKHLENEKIQLEQTLDRRATELAEVQAQVHKFELKSIKQDSDKERFSCELNESRNAKRELMELVEQKNAELVEKNSLLKGYLDKIVFLTDERSTLAGKLREAESGLNRSQAVQARLTQEKELLEQHNAWLNEELTDQMGNLLRDRKTFSDVEIELRSKLSMAEEASKETTESLQKSKEQAKELELRLHQTREELRVAREEASANEDHLTLEVETASKLAELYKQSSEEWAKKAADLEGVIKALEVHLNQVESDHKSHLEREVESQKESEQRIREFQDKVEKLEKELIAMKNRKENESLLLLEDIPSRASPDLAISNLDLSSELHEDGLSLPLISSGVSGTALAAALLRDGWNLTRVYIKYQEAVDAWRHERQERKYSQTILQRVLQEIEQRAELILEERAEHNRMAEAYAIMEEKLHVAIEEQNSRENQIKTLRAELRQQDRELHGARQECSNLQTEVAVLLKECADIRLRFGEGDQLLIKKAPEERESLSPEKTSVSINDRSLTFKNILELVEQNSGFRDAVRTLSHQNEECEAKLRETFQMELKKRTDEASQKVTTIIKKSEEQMQLIQSLQGTVGMYKRFYEEELKAQRNSNGVLQATDVSRAEDRQKLIVTSKEDIEKVRKDNADRLAIMEKELIKARQDGNIIRTERDRLIVEADFTKEQLQRFVKESENQRKEMDAVLSRNVEFSQIITDYQRRLRESSEKMQSVEEKSRRLSVEVSVLEREKELLTNAEKKACQELSSLSDRAHRLQATLDSIDTTREAQEKLRSAEKKRLEDEVSRMQREWMEMKHELDSERAHARHLSDERDRTAKETIDRIQLISKDLADALKKVSTAETQGHLAEARSKELEASLKKAEEKIQLLSSQESPSKDYKNTVSEGTNQVMSILEQLEEAREQIDRLTEELGSSKNHIEQYKRLAQHNEEALIEIQRAYNTFKEESEKVKEQLRSELTCIKDKSMDLERHLNAKEMELTTVVAEKEEALRSAEKEATILRETESGNRMLLGQAEERIKTLKSELEKEHFQWRAAQNNYERQVMLQADTIRELTAISEHNTILEKEVLELREKAELAMTDLTSSQVTWDMEKASLQSEIEKLAQKTKELQDQNRILLDQVEGATGLVSEQARIAGDHLDMSANTGNEMQDVIRYLRRSKETSDMEITLLKQERLRLQKQLESALRAAEEAQASLRRQHEATSLTLCTEQELRSLQAQVREMTLLRESNEQLRLENKRNFDECQNLVRKLQNIQEETESLQKSVRDKEVELEATIKIVDLQKVEASRWENRASQLLEKYRTVDLDEHNRLQSELSSTQETSALYQSELETAREHLQKLQDVIRNAEQEISVKGEKITELERKAKDLEASMQGTVKTETDKLKKQVLFFKRKTETLIKEKDDTRDLLSKQLDELRANANKKGGDSYRSENQIRQEIASQHEQAQKENENLLREKDSRIQTLERTLEREREELRKDKEVLRTEKARRQRDRQAYMDAVAKLDNDKQKLLEEVNVLKREKESLSENVQGKKSGRKIVRPKIESPVESHIHLETNDMATDTLIEATETEAEVRDETKPSTELVETVSTTSAIVVASLSTLSDGGPSMRKRFSGSMHGDELISGTGLGNDPAPAIKRQRGLECETAIMVPTTVVESIVTVEPGKSSDMELENVATADLASLDGIDINPIDSLAENLVTPMMEQNMGIRPQGAQKEQTLTKRPRIVRSDFVPATEKEEPAITLENERAFVIDHLRENVATNEKGVQYVAPSEETTESELVHQSQSPQREGNMDIVAESISLEALGVATSHSLPQVPVLPLEMEESENLIGTLNNSNQSPVAFKGTPLPSDLGFLTPAKSGHEVSTHEIPLSGISRPSDSVLDVEDGEIEPDDPNESNVESLSQQIVVEADEDKNGSDILVDSVRKHEEHTEETLSEDKASKKFEDPESLEGSNMIQKPHEGHSEKPRPHAVARQVAKGVSSLLVEKARERSFSRKAGLLHSPGRRIPRGAKRSAGLQHGRTINPAEFGEEPSKEEVSQSTETESAQAAETQDSADEEK